MKYFPQNKKVAKAQKFTLPSSGEACERKSQSNAYHRSNIGLPICICLSILQSTILQIFMEVKANNVVSCANRPKVEKISILLQCSLLTSFKSIIALVDAVFTVIFVPFENQTQQFP